MVGKNNQLINFSINKINTGYTSLSAILSLQDVFGINPDTFCWNILNLRKELYTLIRRWRKMCYVFRGHKWAKAVKQPYKLFNCPPISCYSFPESKFCYSDFVCPFCWARALPAKLYKQIFWCLFGTVKPSNYAELNKTADLVFLEVNKEYNSVSFKLINKLNKLVVDRNKSLFKKYKNQILTSVSYTVIYPTDNNRYLYSARFILITIPNLIKSPFVKAYLPYAKISPITLAKFIGASCKYPRSLLEANHSKLTTNILNIRSRQRTSGIRLYPSKNILGYMRQYSQCNSFDIHSKKIISELNA